MRASIVIRSKDEADRLRLTLTSLACQSERAEVVVVNDGSSDHTHEVISEMEGELQLVAIHHDKPAGRSGAANAAASRSSGDIVIFPRRRHVGCPRYGGATHGAAPRRQGSDCSR